MESDKTFELMTKMYAEIQEMNTRLSNVETDVKDLKADTAKNSILLEKVDSNVKLLAEGHESFRNQIGRNNSDDKRSINEKLDVIELAVTSASRSISDINDTIDVLKDTTANNDIDIKILKRQRKSVV